MASTPSEYNLVTLDELTALTAPLSSSDIFYILQYDSKESVYKENANKVTLETLTNYFDSTLGSSSHYNAGVNAGEVLLIPDNGKIPDNLISDNFATSTSLNTTNENLNTTTTTLNNHIVSYNNPHRTNYGLALNALHLKGIQLPSAWYGGFVLGPNSSFREDIMATSRSLQYNKEGGSYNTFYITSDILGIYHGGDTSPTGFFIKYGNLSIEGQPVTIVPPTSANHAATKNYVDNLVSNSTISNKIVNVSGDTVTINPTNDGNNPLYLINHTSGTSRTISFNNSAFTSTDHYYNFILTVSNSTSETLALSLNINSGTFNTDIEANKKAYINFMLVPASLGNQLILTHIYTV